MTFPLREDYTHLKPCEHGGRVAELTSTNQAWLDFSASVNPFPYPDIESIIHCSAGTISAYPDNTYARFRAAAAVYLGVPPATIVPGNGSMELIRLVTSSTLNKGDVAIVPAPTFDEYEFACRLAGARIVVVPAWETQSLHAAIVRAVATHDAKMVFLGNPNSPTGELMQREEVLDIIATCSEHGTLLFVDEAFIELSDPKLSVVGIDSESESVFVLRSLTKSFAVPGLRVGFGIAGPTFAAALECIRPPWNLNSIAAETATHLLENCHAYLRSSRACIAEERERLQAKLAAMPGLEPRDSDANFLMVNVAGTSLTSAEFTQRMLQHGILVRDCSSFKLAGTDYIRIAVRARAENDRLLDAMCSVLGLTS